MEIKNKPDAILTLAIKKLELKIDQQQEELLLRYCSLLLEGLSKQRLTGECRLEELVNRQIYDCLYPLKKVIFGSGSRIVDLGSGGGLPGIPIAVCVPECRIYLIEANQKKAAFLVDTARSLKLDNVFVLNERAEHYGRAEAHREQYHYVLSKAVAAAAVLAELALPLLLPGGQAIFYKGPRGEEEMNEATKAISVCGGSLVNRYDYKLPAGEQRSIYLVEKINPSPSLYPRAAGKPAKNPIKQEI